MASLTFTIKEQGKPVKRVTFKGDNAETLMKPPCTTKVYDRDAPPKQLMIVKPLDLSLLDCRRSKNAWRPKRRQYAPKRITIVQPTDDDLLRRKHTNQKKAAKSRVV
jgi:hypothetical protein